MESEALVTVLPRSATPHLDIAPEARRTFSSGTAPYRILLVGAPPVIGDAALADALAAGVAARTGHGVDLESVPAQPLAEAAAGALLSGRDLECTDAVLVVLDPEHVRRAAATAPRDLLAALTPRLAVGSPLVVVIPPPLALGIAPQQVDELVAAVRVEADALVPVVVLADGSPEHRSARWADAIAAATSNGLIEPMVRFVSDDHYDEDLRLDAVDRLPPRDGLWVAQFQQIVDDARQAYGTTAAAMSIIDADYARYGVTVGYENKAVRRGQTICNRVLRTYGGLIVGDAQADPRFQRNPDVISGEVRFYAGYRIESAGGAPLGSLCVFDPEPRDEVDEQDLVLLRDLAVDAQRRIWSFQQAF